MTFVIVWTLAVLFGLLVVIVNDGFSINVKLARDYVGVMIILLAAFLVSTYHVMGLS